MVRGSSPCAATTSAPPGTRLNRSGGPRALPTLLDRRVARALARCAWLSDGDTLLAAISGGPDSTALLHALAFVAPDRRLRILVVHVDHGLRATSADDARRVRDLAAATGLRCLVLHAGPRIARGGAIGRAGGLEQVAREARYALLARVARRTGAVAIAAGHTRDDQAETVLLRLFRGSGPRGLGGMRPVSRLYGARVVRPMLGAGRAEVEVSLRAHRASALTDDSNADLDRERNWIRHEILPALKARWGESLPRRLARAARLARATADAEDQYAAAAYDAVVIRPPGVAPGAPSIALDGPRLASYSCAVQRSVVRRALRELAGTLSGFSLAHVSRILALAIPGDTPRPARRGSATDLPHGLRVTVRGTSIVLAPRSASTPERSPGTPAS